MIHVTEETFNAEVLQSDNPVLVDFWAPWCGPCRMVGPVIEELADEYAGRVKVVKLNTDENIDVAGEYGIQSIPTLAIFRAGRPVDGVLGAVPKSVLKELIDRQLEPIPVHK